MTNKDEDAILEIDTEIIKKASDLIVDALLNKSIFLNSEEQLENQAINSTTFQVIDLRYISSIVAGVTDPIGQLRDFLRQIFDWLWDKISSAIADVLAKTLQKIGEIAPAIASNIAQAINIISSAISSSITAISSSISLGLTQISSGITSLSVSITSLGTSISGTIVQIGTSISTQIMSVANSISNSIVSISGSLAYSISALGTSLSQAILSISTSISSSILSISTSLSGAILSLSTSISGAILNISSSLSFAINQLGGTISAQIVNITRAISTSISMLSASISKAIIDTSHAIMQSIVGLSTALSSAIVSLSTSISYALGTLGSTIIAIGNLLAGRIDVAIGIMQKFFPAFTDSLSTGFTKMTNAITEGYKTISTVFRESYEKTVRQIQTLMEDFSESINKIADRTIKSIAEGMSLINRTLSDNLREMSKAISDSAINIANAIKTIHKSLLDTILETYKKTSDALNQGFLQFSDILAKTMEKLSDTLNNIAKNTTDTIIDTGYKLKDYIEDTSKSITDTILSNLEKTMDKLKKVLEDWSNLMMEINKTFQGFVNSILLLPERLDPTMKKHAEYTWDEYWIRYYDKTSPKMKKIYERLPEFFISSSQAPWDVIVSFFSDVPKGLYNSLLWLGEGLSNALQQIITYFANIIDVFSKYVWEWIDDAKSFFMQTISNIGAGIGVDMFNFTTLLINSFSKTISTVSDAFINVFKSFGWGSLELINNLIFGLFKQLFIDVFPDRISQSLPTYELNSISQMMSKSIFWSIGLMALPLIIQIPLRMITWHIRGLGIFLTRLGAKLSVSAKPVGVGISGGFNILASIGSSLSRFATSYEEAVRVIPNAFAYGLGIWASQPLSKLMNYYLRDIVPVTLPNENTIIEMLRRRMEYMADTLEPSTDFQKTIMTANMLLALYGYPSALLNWYSAYLKQDYVDIIDRFGSVRKFPRSIMHELPSMTEMTRMMIKDIFIGIDEFIKASSLRGMTPDIATLYYVLHFRYPPPERLWAFVTRGISGLLWARVVEEKPGEIRDEVSKLKTFMPVDATSLNFRGDILFNAFSKYMKWHDFARFSWIDGFTSDNIIYIDTLADIPTKIDQRWMVRFALYELLGEKGITIKDPSSSFVTKLVENTPKGQITLDLTNFCRTLQATGLHPYYVPLVSVAETINSIADERTLIRTGVLNLYKEGFLTLDGVNTLFSGVIYTAFKVSYYDMSTHQWKEGYINAPLRYLPMESKLMQLRAIMDRSLDILKDIQKDILTGYQEYIIETYDEFKAKFERVIQDINQIYSVEYKYIVGQEPPESIKLKFVESYYKPYVDALQIWRDVHVYRRIRTWTMRWIGWLMYRIAYAVVKPEELSELVTFLCRASKLTEAERQFLSKIMELMANLSVREYIPTPSQLATLSEYVKITDDAITKVFNARGIPEEFRSIWMAYIRVRPIADDCKAVITAYRRALLYATPEKPIPVEIVNAVKKTMNMIGFTEEEEALLNLRVALEEFVLNAKEYIPTPMTLATLSEYVPVPKELINKALMLRHVPEDWASLWIRYIDIRPIADDIRALITTLFRAIEYTADAKNYIGKVESIAKEVGYRDKELEIFKLRAELEELIYKSREYIPTPMTLATISEVLPEARYYFDDMVSRLRISPEWSSLWAKYIDLKPLIDDIKKMITRAEDLYCSFMITDDTFISILNSIRDLLGYTDKEIEFLLYTTRLRRHQLAWKEVIGDVDRMLMLSEYSPTAREYALGTLYKMIDSLNIDDENKALLKKMWEDFIRIKPVIDEVRKYVTDLINAFVDGTINQQIFESELEALRDWGLDSYEIQFYKAIATLRKARKLKIQFY